MLYWVYILWSNKLNRYYVGPSSDIDRRLQEHNAGKSGYTSRGIPWTLVYQESSESKQTAWKREMEIKRYKGGVKFKALIQNTGGVA